MVFLLHWAGVATSLSAALLAALTLPTALLGAAGAVACLAIGAAVLATARGRSPGGSAAWPAVASALALALVVALGGRGAREPADAAPPPPASTTATGTDPLGGARTAQPPGTVALTDLRPVRDDPDGNLWTSGEEHLAGVPRGRALAATGAWCGTTRLEFALDGEYARFSALTGISDRSAETRPLRFYVLTDGHRAVDLPEVGRAPQPVDVPVAGVTRLVIGVQPPAGDTSTCPGPERVGVFADPLLTRAG